ncbi:hypothetical protein PYW07_012864 [Mythimna separata]|uniref:ZPR1 jelly-roll domain-containing protein n=1 Tax=Mythimna separata TaxID=271217 RepID=A0AAD7Y957_MYTSE|nr:hypothetical protein PYW07_012864 [Mythimna separata]
MSYHVIHLYLNPTPNRFRLRYGALKLCVWRRFVERVEEVLRGERAVTLVLDDPAGNSYVQSLARDPAAPDAGLKITRYTRSYEQNEELGLNDMRTEDYRPSPSRSLSRSPASECAAS